MSPYKPSLSSRTAFSSPAWSDHQCAAGSSPVVAVLKQFLERAPSSHPEFEHRVTDCIGVPHAIAAVSALHRELDCTTVRLVGLQSSRHLESLANLPLPVIHPPNSNQLH